MNSPRAIGRRCFLLLGCGLAVMGGAVVRAEDARQILLNSAAPTAGFWGDQVTEVKLPNGRQSSIRQRVYRKGTILRIEYDKGRTLFDDGKEALIYFPRPNTFEKRPTSFGPERLARERRQILGKRLIVEPLPDGEVAGRAAWVISVKSPNGNSRRLWVDKQTYVTLRLDEERRGGAQLSTHFTQVQFSDPPAAKLSFTVPADAMQVEPGQGGRPLTAQQAQDVARPWGGVRLPAWAPAGYKLRGFYPHMFGHERGIVAVYDGPARGETLSIFQGPASGMGGMSMKKGRRLRVLAARRGQADVMIVGPLGEADLQRVMDSIP